MTRDGSARPSRSLARLLADQPIERLRALASRWEARPDGGPGWVAPLYRQMLDSSRRDAVLAALSDHARLIFKTLAARRRPLTRRELLRILPFAEDDLDRSLDELEGVGLAWSQRPAGRSGLAEVRAWMVPDELAERAPRAGRSGSTSSGRPTGPPSPRRLDRLPDLIDRTGIVPRLINRELQRIGRRMEAAGQLSGAIGTDVEHVAHALGLWVRQRGEFSLGARAGVWQQLGESEQVRVLARLWLVDERAPRTVPPEVRRAIWQALPRLDPEVWYDLPSVAALVAWHAGAVGAERSGGWDAGLSTRPGRSVRWPDILVGLESLGWIGVVVIGRRRDGRPNAVQLTTTGRRALQEPEDAAPDSG